MVPVYWVGLYLFGVVVDNWVNRKAGKMVQSVVWDVTGVLAMERKD